MIDKRMMLRHASYDECDGIPIAYRDVDMKKLFSSESSVLLNGAPRCSECGIALCSCEYAYGHECE